MKIVEQRHLNSHFEIYIDKGAGYADLLFHGGVSLEVINESLLSLIGHPAFRHNMNACYDYSDAIIETTMRDVENHAHFVEEYTGKRGANYKLALVTNETLNAAILNVYKLRISKTSIEAEIFGTKKQALTWLKK